MNAQALSYEIVARGGIFHESCERYDLVERDRRGGETVLVEGAESFSAVADKFEGLTGEQRDTSDRDLYSDADTGHEEQYFAAAGIAGNYDSGIAVIDGHAYEFARGEAWKKRVGSTYDGEDARYEVVENGDETTWREI